MVPPDEEVGSGDRFIIEQFRRVKTPVILVINKVDQVNKTRIAAAIESFSKEFDFAEIVPVSALSGENLDELLKVIIKLLPPGPKYFPDDAITDQPERFIVSEIIREKMLNLLEEEVPHGTAVEVIQMKEQDGSGLININAVIYCEKDSHKGIIIGRSGQMLKKIGTLAREDIEKLLGARVFLELWVKVKKDWRDNPNALKNLGYK
jgi:GTP-binding protein Era